MRRLVRVLGVVAFATTALALVNQRRSAAALRTGRGQRNSDLAKLGVSVGANYAGTAARKLFANAERPESIYTWKRGIGASALLTRLGTRELAISHEAFDALPASNAVEHLRETLTHHGMLPPRDRQLAAFERWLEKRIVSLADHREIQGPIERFGRWYHL